MSTRALTELKGMFCKELDEIANKREMSAGDLETVHKLTDTIKNIDKICMYDESCGYSQMGDWEMEGRGHSYAGARDSRGRYVSRESHYSRASAKNHMIDNLEDMLEEASSEKERIAIKRCIEQIRQA